MKSSEAAMGGGEVGAQRPVLRSNELKKTGARSTRGQNPLVKSCLGLQRAFVKSRTVFLL